MESSPSKTLSEVFAEARRRGFIGRTPVHSHTAHSHVFARALATVLEGDSHDHPSVLDLGSGGGVPGLVLATTPALKGIRWTFVDSAAKRTAFLTEAVEALGLRKSVTVVTGRAEELARRADMRGQFGAVVSRAFGPPAVTAECAVGFLRLDGTLLVSEPPGESPPTRWPGDGLRKLGLAPAGSYAMAEGHIAQFVLTRPLDDRYPRRTGVPAKRPLF